MNEDKKEATKENIWLTRASDAFEVSTTYIDNNYRRQWEKNISMFRSKHPAGSKYHSDTYRFRSRLFRPKTRSMVRQNEAAAAAAFFTNVEAVNIEPMNRKDQHQAAAAELRDGLLNYRLQHTIPWYLLCVGGMQDAQVQGVVASKQYWKLRTETKKGKNDDGEEVEFKEVVEDQPCINLIPIEYIRIDPGAKWYDPINTSPYVILMEPMYIYEVKEKIAAGEWQAIEDSQWATAIVADNDTTRKTREGGKEDSQDVVHSKTLNEFSKVWVHENFMRINGKEKHYYTLGTDSMLSKVRDLSEVYWHDMRPIAMGSTIVETHTPLPAGTVEIGQDLQNETNEIANSRIDNVKLVLNKRYVVKRGQQVDLKSLLRNAAGSVTLATNPESDIREMEFNDVTGSSYAEQDRINLDYDELLGSFSGSSVQSNRKMNETVGGMQMLRQGANSMTQFLISVFGETWVEKVLRQLDALEQEYETDTDLMSMVAQERNLMKRYNLAAVTPELLKAPCKLVMNMANSATDPMVRLEQFLIAVDKYAELTAKAPRDMDMTEIRKEIFGRLGYKDGSRFFQDQDGDEAAALQQMQQVIQELTQQIEDQAAKAKIEQQGKMAIAQLTEASKERIAAGKEQSENMRQQQKLAAERQNMLDKIALESRNAAGQAKIDQDTALATAKLEDTTRRKEIASNESVAKHQATEGAKTAESTTNAAPVSAEPVQVHIAIDNTKEQTDKTITIEPNGKGFKADVKESSTKRKK